MSSYKSMQRNLQALRIQKKNTSLKLFLLSPVYRKSILVSCTAYFEDCMTFAELLSSGRFKIALASLGLLWGMFIQALTIHLYTQLPFSLYLSVSLPLSRSVFVTLAFFSLSLSVSHSFYLWLCLSLSFSHSFYFWLCLPLSFSLPLCLCRSLVISLSLSIYLSQYARHFDRTHGQIIH